MTVLIATTQHDRREKDGRRSLRARMPSAFWDVYQFAISYQQLRDRIYDESDAFRRLDPPSEELGQLFAEQIGQAAGRFMRDALELDRRLEDIGK